MHIRGKFDRNGSGSTNHFEKKFVRHFENAMIFVDWGDDKTTGIYFSVVFLFYDGKFNLANFLQLEISFRRVLHIFLFHRLTVCKGCPNLQKVV